MSGEVFVSLSFLVCASVSPAQEDLSTEFEKRYGNWKNPRGGHGISFSRRWPEFREIVQLGPRALPLLVRKMQEDPSAYGLASAVGMITKKRIRPPAREADMRKIAELYVAWWKEGRRHIRSEFEAEYSKWRAEREGGATILQVRLRVLSLETKKIETASTETLLGRSYERLRDMGIDILPLLVERFKAGDYDLLSLFGELTDGQGVTHVGSLEDRVRFALEWWEKNKKDWLLPPAEEEPKEFGGHRTE